MRFFYLLLSGTLCLPLFGDVGFQYPESFANLPRADKALMRDLILLDYPPLNWRDELPPHAEAMDYDVVIIGGGMAGLTAGAALYKEGIFRIAIFDQSPKGMEGPWVTYARMKTLRTEKEVMGTALGIPHLTFYAWFDAQYGAAAWEKMDKIPNRLWMDYLNWYRDVMQLPVINECILTRLTPLQQGFELEMLKQGNLFKVTARKVILATGRLGFGGPQLPEFAAALPKTSYVHTSETFDFTSLADKSVGVIGAGASSFDAALAALQSGAKDVHLIVRRKELPKVYKFAAVPAPGFYHGYYHLNDTWRWRFMTAALDAGIPPTRDAVNPCLQYPNFSILLDSPILEAVSDGNTVVLQLPKEKRQYDFLIFATGFDVNGHQQSELSQIIDQISLWKDHLPPQLIFEHTKMGEFPYLGPSFEFTPKEQGGGLFLKDLYCFNYAALLSHGLVNSDMRGISVGATRLAQGIAADFFIQECEWYLEQMKRFEGSELDETAGD